MNEPTDRILAALARCQQCATEEDGKVTCVYLDTADLGEIHTQALRARREQKAAEDEIRMLRDRVEELEG